MHLSVFGHTVSKGFGVISVSNGKICSWSVCWKRCLWFLSICSKWDCCSSPASKSITFGISRVWQARAVDRRRCSGWTSSTSRQALTSAWHHASCLDKDRCPHPRPSRLWPSSQRSQERPRERAHERSRAVWLALTYFGIQIADTFLLLCPALLIQAEWEIVYTAAQNWRHVVAWPTSRSIC